MKIFLSSLLGDRQVFGNSGSENVAKLVGTGTSMGLCPSGRIIHGGVKHLLYVMSTLKEGDLSHWNVVTLGERKISALCCRSRAADLEDFS